MCFNSYISSSAQETNLISRRSYPEGYNAVDDLVFLNNLDVTDTNNMIWNINLSLNMIVPN